MNLLKSFAATIAVLIVLAALIVAVAGVIAVLVKLGVWAFAVLIFVIIWGGIHTDMARAGYFE